MRIKTTTQSGFTMIELAVVLVVIGTILASVFRGRDVTDSIRIKEFTTWVFKWEDAQKQYEDRVSHFAGDGVAGDASTHNGIIADALDCGGCVPDSAIALLRSAVGIVDVPPPVLRLGSHSFFIKFGNDNGGNGGFSIQLDDNGTTARDDRNILIICVSEDCTIALGTQHILDYFEGLDTAIDGVPHPGSGRLRALNDPISGPFTNGSTCVAGTNDCYDEVSERFPLINPSTTYSINDYGAVYYFDVEHE